MFLSTSQLNHPLFVPTSRALQHLEMLTISSHKSRTLLQFDQPVYLAPARKKALLVLTDDLLATDQYQYLFLDQPLLLNKGVFFNILPIDTDDCTIALSLNTKEQPTLHPVEEYTNKITTHPFNIHLTHLQWVKEKVNVPTSLNTFQIVICLEGEYRLEIKDQPNEYLYPLQVFVTSTASLTFNPLTTGRVLVIECVYDGTLFNQSFKNLITLQQKQVLLSLHHGWSKELYAYLYHWIYSLFLNETLQPQKDNPLSTSMKDNAQRELFLEMREFLLADLKNRNQVQHLVDAFDLSRSTIQTIFTNQAKTTPVDYINRLRIEESQRLIKESSLNLTQISQNLGFKTLSYFSRAFTKHVGMSPSAYAKTIQSRK